MVFHYADEQCSTFKNSVTFDDITALFILVSISFQSWNLLSQSGNYWSC